MKIVSWNVNGLRACCQKNFIKTFKELNADIFCIQETKMQEGDLNLQTEGYYQYWNSANRKGYSGTAVFTKMKPCKVYKGLGKPEYDSEGRVIILEYSKFYAVTVYTPNSKRDLSRLPYRQKWDERFKDVMNALNSLKPVIMCGDFNVCHKEIDLARPENNLFSPGYTFEERTGFTNLLSAGFVDSFRQLNPEVTGKYSWWSYMGNARVNNVGWRLDYVLTSEDLKGKYVDAIIHSEILGSDHCPVSLNINIEF